jgi:hypothetical protein
MIESGHEGKDGTHPSETTSTSDGELFQLATDAKRATAANSPALPCCRLPVRHRLLAHSPFSRHHLGSTQVLPLPVATSLLLWKSRSKLLMTMQAQGS